MECNLLKLLTSLKSLNCREEEFLFTSENTFYLKSNLVNSQEVF